MKKEIEVWVSKILIENGDPSPCIYREKPQGEYIKATLIIDVPEPKIEISQSEFTEIFYDGVKQQHLGKSMKEYIDSKLFGKEE